MLPSSQRENLTGAAMMTASMAGFTFNDAIMKVLLQGIPFYQGLLMRAVVVAAMIIVFAYATGGLDLRLTRRDSWIVSLRTAGEVSATYLFITALLHMPLANAAAIMQSLSLTVALAGAIIFKEPLGWRRLLAIFAGFCGVILIIRPGDDFNIYSLYALGAVIVLTLRDLATRRLSSGVKTLPVAFYATLGNVCLGIGLFAFGGGKADPWQVVSTHQIWLIFGASACLVVGYSFAVSAMRIGTLAVVTPFRYTAILFALILGLVVFDDWPDVLTLVGAGIVVLSGLVTLYREQLALKREHNGG